MNGDGYGDVVVGAPGSTNPNAIDAPQMSGPQYYKSGAAFVYYGSATGLFDTPGWTQYQDAHDHQFGSSVATAGDVNGDGYADLVIGAGANGTSYVYLGSDAGVGFAHTFSAGGAIVHTAGDRNGDGYAEVLTGTPSAASVITTLGSPAGLAIDEAIAMLGADFKGFGVVAPGGDLDGDGYGDLAVGAPGANTEGAVYLYYGGPGSTSTSTGAALTGSNDGNTWSIDGIDAGAQLGFSVAHAGDVNGDGIGDVILGAPFHDAGMSEGRAFLFHGKTTGLFPDWVWSAGGTAQNVQFGAAVDGAGDVNGDGYGDVIVGVPEHPTTADAKGRIAVYSGGPGGLEDEPFATHENDELLARMGSVVASAGDLNNDGYADLLVGTRSQAVNGGAAYAFQGGPSGISLAWTMHSLALLGAESYGVAVSSAGDINRDGFLDVIVGSPDFGASVPLAAQGRAEIYLGGSTGLGLDEDWFVVGDDAAERAGASVAGVGDVNDDGYDDVAVGVPGAPFGGQVRVYLGGPTGPSTSVGIVFEGDDLGEPGLGTTTSSAGDVNNDGRPDIVAGYANERISLFLSGPGGDSWSDPGTFGRSLSGGGDVNGDGFADIVVGRPNYTPGVLTDAGRAEVLFGNGIAGRSLNVRQRRSATGMPIAHRGLVSADGVQLSALGRTPFGRGDVRLEWEIAQEGVVFGTFGTDTGVTPTWTDSGGEDTYIYGNTTGFPGANEGSYHWRARVQYNPVTTPYAPASHWLTLTENGWRQVDLRVTDKYQNGVISIQANDPITALYELGTTSPPPAVVLSVANSGDGPLTWVAVEDPPVPWLTLSPDGAAGQQPYDPAISLIASFSPAGLADGVHATSVRIDNINNAADHVTIPVAFTIVTARFNPGDQLEGYFPQVGSTQGAVSFYGLKGMELRLTYSHTNWKLKTHTTVEAPSGKPKSFTVQHKGPAKKKKLTLKHDGLYTLRVDALEGWYKYTILTAYDLPKIAMSHTTTKKQLGSSGEAIFKVRALPGAMVVCKFKPEESFTGPMTLSVEDPDGVAYDVSGFQQPLGGGLELAGIPLPNGGCYTFTVGGFQQKSEKVTGVFTITQPDMGEQIVQIPLVPGGN